MKLFRLIVHQKAFSDEEVLISPKDCPDIKEGDILEVYHPQPEEENPRLLIQIRCFKDDLQTKDTISIEQSIAMQFGLRSFKDVMVRIVTPSSVALDSVELTFKDQYMGRSEMWRIKQLLTGNCVYTNKKLELYGGAVRCQVYEMWSQGDRVACGVITDETKVVFRSSTSMVYLFIQMSSEMWDFDINGDLYFEKAVNGFLADLFQKWKKNGSNHEVTIVLFSRTIYEATCLEEFPEHMRECLQQDYRGRYYEDFYRIAVQNERYDDWSGILVQLRHLFTGYLKVVLEYHSRPGFKIPRAVNSTATQGNFLEVLNISLNVFEKHYLDRSFDRTGQLSVVITPGVGIFEVDRELTNVTKQRVIDNGVGSDLVCVGEQPLHAVPLFKFHNKDNRMSIPDDYSMPHWINLSFYSTNKKISYSKFVPRIKLPPVSMHCNNSMPKSSNKLLDDSECIHNTFFDYDAYDNQVYQLPPAYGTGIHQRAATVNNKKFLSNLLEPEDQLKIRRKLSDPNLSTKSAISSHTSAANGSSASLPKFPKQLDSNAIKEYLSPLLRPIVGSAGSSPCANSNHEVCRSKALINPFDPSHVTIKLTSNRRRWTHIFPKGPSGVLIQQHHYQAVPTTQSNVYDNSIMTEVIHLDRSLSTSSNMANQHLVLNSSLLDYLKKRPNYQSPGHHNYNSSKTGSKALTFLWGATGEQEWTPAITTGVDWKSLTIPACLPITTDYFPDKRALQMDYVVSLYNLLPDDVNADFAQQRTNYKKPLTTVQVFKELVSQRLAQGFQLILIPESIQQAHNNKSSKSSNGTVLRKRTPESEISETYYLSIGRIFHKISLVGSSITVTRYRPRHPYPPFNIQYRYRFQAPYHDTYEVSWVSFTTEKLENYNWNYLDHYICTRGDTDFHLVQALKYWRFRLYLIPLSNPATKKIIDGAPHYDVYFSEANADHTQLSEGFLKFIETVVNKIKRTNNSSKKARMSFSIPQSGGFLIEPRRHSMTVVSQKLLENAVGGCHSPFRERLGSNRLPDKPRPRLDYINFSFAAFIDLSWWSSGGLVFCFLWLSLNFTYCFILFCLLLYLQNVSIRTGERYIGNSLRSGSKVMDKGRNSPAVDPQQSNSADTQSIQDDKDSISSQELSLISSTATSAEILEAMKNSSTGVSFLHCQLNLPPFTFVSADAVQWLMLHVEGINTYSKAVQIMETMREEKLICHASGDSKKTFVFGFMLFYIPSSEKEGFTPSGDLQSFQNEWLEVEIRSSLNWGRNSPQKSLSIPPAHLNHEMGVPHFLCDDIDIPYLQGDVDIDCSVCKQMHLDIDVSNKSDRVEWGHARYHSIYRPDQAYEVTVEWLIASGSIVSELLLGWFRKAQSCGFQMVPIPHDPLALPYSTKSDPLRGPFFVPLNIKCLIKRNRNLFDEFREDSWSDRMFLFQEAIIARFGFLPCLVEPMHEREDHVVQQEHQYIHSTGTVFVLIPSPKDQAQRNRHRVPSISQRRTGTRYPAHIDVIPSPHEAYITRHVSGKSKDDYDNNKRMGFLWSWNHMVSKRWRNNQAVDHQFQVRMLKDFREFCDNKDDRLKIFWEESWEAKENACIH